MPWRWDSCRPDRVLYMADEDRSQDLAGWESIKTYCKGGELNWLQSH